MIKDLFVTEAAERALKRRKQAKPVLDTDDTEKIMKKEGESQDRFATEDTEKCLEKAKKKECDPFLTLKTLTNPMRQNMNWAGR
jgi:hypothetical protein